MNGFFFTILLLFIGLNFGCQNGSDGQFMDLHTAIGATKVYDVEKMRAIETIKKTLSAPSSMDLKTEFDICEKLFYAYQTFNYDSAFVYAIKLLHLSKLLKDPSAMSASKMNFASILVYSGMYKEAFDTLRTIEIKDNPRVKTFYYGLMARCYNDLADYDNHAYYSNGYRKKAGLYLDSSLALSTSGTFHYDFSKVYIDFRRGNNAAAYAGLQAIFKGERPLSPHEYAIASSILANVYEQNGQADSAIVYFVKSALADIKSSVKETTSIAKLAGLLFTKGDTKNASLFIKKANDDAAYYGAKQRKIQIGAILPLIESSVINTVEEQKRVLFLSVFLVSFLLLLVLGLMLTVYKQVGKLRIERNKVVEAHEQQQAINAELLTVNGLKDGLNQQLMATNTQLLSANQLKDALNQQLTMSNEQLMEANKIKEAYIGYYFTMDAEIFSKFEKFKTAIDKKLTEGKPLEVRHILKTFDPQKEKEALLQNFDTVFITLFPDFVKEFNSLFKEDTQINLKAGQPLTTELRIFALIRLGIKENEKIAQILGYSVNTIYMYKTKVRNKSWLPNDVFDQKLIDITTLKH